MLFVKTIPPAVGSAYFSGRYTFTYTKKPFSCLSFLGYGEIGGVPKITNGGVTVELLTLFPHRAAGQKRHGMDTTFLCRECLNPELVE